MKKHTRIYPVPSHLVEQMWPHMAPHLERGAAVADTTLDEIKAGVEAETDRLWAIFVNGTLTGAFVTAICEDDAGRWLGVYALGGKGVRQWAGALDATMQLEAKTHGVSTIRFAGRGAWSRVLPDLRACGADRGHTVFERVAA